MIITEINIQVWALGYSSRMCSFAISSKVFKLKSLCNDEALKRRVFSSCATAAVVVL